MRAGPEVTIPVKLYNCLQWNKLHLSCSLAIYDQKFSSFSGSFLMKTIGLISISLILVWSFQSKAKECSFIKPDTSYTIEIEPDKSILMYGPTGGGATGNGGELKYDFTMTDGVARYSNKDFFLLTYERAGTTYVRLVDRVTWKNLISHEPCVASEKQKVTTASSTIECRAPFGTGDVLIMAERLPVAGSTLVKRVMYLVYRTWNSKSRVYVVNSKVEMVNVAWAGGPPTGSHSKLPYLASSDYALNLNLFKETVNGENFITLKSPPSSKYFSFENLKCAK